MYHRQGKMGIIEGKLANLGAVVGLQDKVSMAKDLGWKEQVQWYGVG